MKIYDIFCDASVDKSLRGACAGALITERGSQFTQLKTIIQPNGTNNSGEICAILIGVLSAIDIKEKAQEACAFNIFSDSIISIKGAREWIFNWIANANSNGNFMLVNSSGEPVSNQLYFKLIFNHIIMHSLEVHFWHQIGHVERNYVHCAKSFQKVNGINLFRLGLTAEGISAHNNYVDHKTRDILRGYTHNQQVTIDGLTFDIIANTEYENIAQTMPIPYINVMNEPPTIDDHYKFALLQGKQIIRRYAELVHAMEYPGGNKLFKYIS